MEATPRKILVAGATGALGRPLVEALARQGFAVRAMARDSRRLAEAFGQRFELAAGDATSAPAVEAALDGCFGVHLCLAHGSDESPAVEAVARAAARLGVRRIGYVSGTTVCEKNGWFPMVAGKLRAERILQDGSVPWTIFRPTWFMEAVENFMQHGLALCFGRGEMRFHLLASVDFAPLVARAFALPEAENRAFRVLGPEPVRIVDAVDRVRDALHPEIRSVTHLPFWLAGAIARLRGKNGRQMADAIALMRYFEAVEEGAAEPESVRVLGACTTTLDGWLERRRAKTA